jgi:hypothetical protein
MALKAIRDVSVTEAVTVVPFDEIWNTVGAISGASCASMLC